ncbi:MAG: hypothetical protein ACE5I8_08525 [Thermodesulfobacteriota bacterium]
MKRPKRESIFVDHKGTPWRREVEGSTGKLVLEGCNFTIRNRR